jgi:hypothetical protein
VSGLSATAVRVRRLRGVTSHCLLEFSLVGESMIFTGRV